MKPRIVREQIVAGKHTDFYGPAGRSECVGKAALVLYWPLKCPYTPNDVMAACERHGWTLTGVPEPRQDLWAVRLQGHEPCSALLTPEFMEEPAAHAGERDNHCKDCCCARSWEALGITTHTGMSIVEHIEALREENERLRTRTPQESNVVCPGCGHSLAARWLGQYRRCLSCGATLSDQRRPPDRRKGERRKFNDSYRADDRRGHWAPWYRPRRPERRKRDRRRILGTEGG